MIVFVVPGEPQPQQRAGRRIGFKHAVTTGPGGRPRVVAKPFVRSFDQHDSANWKARAKWYMRDAMKGATPLQGPLRLVVVVILECPKSDHRKTAPPGLRWAPKDVGDWDNFGKIISDAANGVLWVDDAQVVDARVLKLVGAQGESPHMLVAVEPCHPDQLAPTLDALSILHGVHL